MLAMENAEGWAMLGRIIAEGRRRKSRAHSTAVQSMVLPDHPVPGTQPLVPAPLGLRVRGPRKSRE